jgi:acyl dehydratase
MTLETLEGVTFGPYPMRVCKEKVDEFLLATGGDAGRWTEFAPPGHLASALFVVAPELLAKLDGFSVVHGEQTFRWLQPLVIEQDLHVSGTVTRMRERSGAYFVSFEMTITDGIDQIAGGTSLFLVAGADPNTGGGSDAPNVGPEDRGNPGHGQKSASRVDLVRYAAATRDWNPIHWDHGSAVAAGLDGVVVHGLLQAAWALDAAASHQGGTRPFDSARIRFRNPLFPASPVDVVPERSGVTISVEVSSGGTQYLSAQIELAGE